MAVCSRLRPDLTPELVGVKFLSRPVRLPKLTHQTGESHTMVTFRALSMRDGGKTQKFSGVTPIRRPCQDAPGYLAQIRANMRLCVNLGRRVAACPPAQPRPPRNLAATRRRSALAQGRDSLPGPTKPIKTLPAPRQAITGRRRCVGGRRLGP